MERRLTDFALLSGISPPCRDALESHAVVRRFQPGGTLYRIGSPPDELFALMVGRLKVGRILENGAAVTLDILTAGDIVGLVGALSGRPHGVAATCLVPVTALVWRSAFFLDWSRRDAALAFGVNRLLAGRLRAMADLVEELTPSSVEPRLARVLLRLGDAIGEGDGAAVRIDVTQGDLAELARTTVPTVSRILARWRNGGIVASHRGFILLLDREPLVQIGRNLG
jgi:CRP/FNR family transcriptional regulator